MRTQTSLSSGAVSVIDYRRDAGPADAPYPELHRGHSLGYVRKGSFGYRYRGESFELVAGAVLVGHPGDEFTCAHDHQVCGDECLAFQFSPEVVETLDDKPATWRIGGVPPLSELMVIGELAQSAAEGANDLGLDEIGLLFVASSTPRPDTSAAHHKCTCAIGAGRWKRRSGWMHARNCRSIWKAQRARRA